MESGKLKIENKIIKRNKRKIESYYSKPLEIENVKSKIESK